MESRDSVGLSDYSAALRRRRRLAVSLGLPIFIAAAILAVALPNVYRSTAVFKLKESQNTQEQQTGGGDSYADRYVSVLTEMVLRPDNLNVMLEQVTPPGAADRNKAIARLAKGIKVNMVTEKILDQMSGRERAILSGFTVSADSRDPNVAWHA